MGEEGIVRDFIIFPILTLTNPHYPILTLKVVTYLYL